MEKKDLKPAGVFKYFEEICQVPRPSKKEEKMIAYLKAIIFSSFFEGRENDCLQVGNRSKT